MATKPKKTTTHGLTASLLQLHRSIVWQPCYQYITLWKFKIFSMELSHLCYRDFLYMRLSERPSNMVMHTRHIISKKHDILYVRNSHELQSTPCRAAQVIDWHLPVFGTLPSQQDLLKGLKGWAGTRMVQLQLLGHVGCLTFKNIDKKQYAVVR